MNFKKIGKIETQEAQVEQGFNPEKLVDDKDWQLLTNEMEDARNDENWVDFFALTAEMVRAFPEKSRELNIYEEDISINAWSEAEVQLDAYKGERSWGKFFDLATSMGTVFSERVQTLKEKGILDDNVQKEMAEKIDEDKKEGEWARFFSDIDKANILFPEIVSDIDIEENIGEIEESINKRRKPGKWKYFCEQAAALRMLGHDIEISEDEWNNIKDDFESLKASDNKDWVDFATSINLLNK